MHTSLGEMKVKPAALAGDPDNRQHTDALAKACNATVVQVPGHYAQIASAMAMNEPDREVIGVLFGSENPGDDGNLWGGDFFTCTLNGFQRISHLDYLLVPKNERTETYPDDAGLFLLCQVFGREVEGMDIPFTRTVDSEMIAEACEMLHDAGAVVMSTSAERLAGAVAAVTGICTEASFLGEPLLRLTTLADQEVKGAYSYEGNETIAFRPLVEEIVQDIRKELRNSVIAAKFINTLIDIICDRAEHIRKTRGLNRVVLAGEMFQNPLMLEKTTAWLRQIGFEAFSSTELPAGYGGLLPGRLAVAAKMR